MFLRTTAMTGMALGGLGFMAGATAGFGFGLAALGTACAARAAWKRRKDWPSRDRDTGTTSMASDMPDEGDPLPSTAI